MVRLAALALLTLSLPATATQLEWVRSADIGKGFLLEASGASFEPLGFNYDHDQSGRLIEDYWDLEWYKVEQDFLDMKRLGANVVRIHLQLGRFMERPNRARKPALRNLRRLIALAERTGLYLDITGAGNYRKEGMPAWYGALSEKERWSVQARFWDAVASVGAGSPAVFCYNLMNEPAVSAEPRTDWLAVRKRDPGHLVTVGLFLIGDHAENLPIGATPEELAAFIKASRRYASGWMGFYWGKPQDPLMAGWLELFQRLSTGRT